MEELTLRTEALNLAARAWGPKDGQRCLGLHGWLDSCASFDRLAPLLGGLRLICLDLPGHGLSEHRHLSASYDFINWIPDVIAAADALGWPQFSLLGHSLGASIALCLAGTSPHRVERVALLDGIGPWTRPPWDVGQQLERSIALRRERLTTPPVVYADRTAAADKLRESIAGLTRDAAQVLVARGTKEVQGGVTWRHDPMLRAKSLLYLTEEHVKAFFNRVRCPVLMVRPEDGWSVEMTWIEQRLSWLQDARIEMVQGGHHVHLVEPERVAGVVGDFLKGI